MSDIIDVNVVASGNLARLVSLEASHLGLSFAVSEKPISGARLYVVAGDIAVGLALPKNSIVVGEGGSFPYPFPIDEFRKALISSIPRENSEKPKPTSKRKKKSAEILLDAKEKSITVRGVSVRLSPTEYLLFEALVARRGEVLSYAEAEELIGGGDSNKVNVYVCYLRKKLEVFGYGMIRSVRNEGFTIQF